MNFRYRVAFGVVVAGCLWLVFLSRGWGLSPFDFVLDDAFVTFRYAEHLAEGLGPVWMEGRAPVEGYSSFLWLLVNAGFEALGWSPVMASQVFSLLGVLALMTGFAFGGRGEAEAPHRLLAAAAVGWSPAFLLISIQGMETGLAAVLATATACAFFRVVEEESLRWFAVFFGVAFLTILARPDTAPFAVVLSVLLLVRYTASKPREVVSTAVACAIVPGVAYFLWRWDYYGHLLPNTAYIKSGESAISTSALYKLQGFVWSVCGPYLAALGLALGWGDGELGESTRFSVAAVGSAVAVGLGAGLFFSPIQGYLWRFQMPYYPVILLLFVRVMDEKSVAGLGASKGGRVAMAAAGLAMLVFPLWTFGAMDENIAQRWHYDRARAGKALAELEGEAEPMLTTEAGAIPYHAGWPAVDLLGLTSEHIAHRGVSREFLDQLEPALVVMLDNLDDPRGADEARRAKLCSYLDDRNYVLRAAVAKTNPDGLNPHDSLRAHLYFVDPTDERAAEIDAALERIEAVTRVDASRLRPALAACDLEGISVQLK